MIYDFAYFLVFDSPFWATEKMCVHKIQEILQK